MSLVGSLLTKNKGKEEIKMKNVKKVLLVIVLTLILGLNINVSAKELDEHAFDNLPETINVDATEKDFADHRDEIEEKAKNEIIDLLKKEGYEFDGNYRIQVFLSLSNNLDSYKMQINLYDISGGIVTIKSDIEAKFKDTDSYNLLRSKIKNMSKQKFYYLDKSENSEVYTYIAKTHTTTDKVVDYLKKSIKKKIADDSISVDVSKGDFGSTSEGFEDAEESDFHQTLKEYKEALISYYPKGNIRATFYKDNVYLGSFDIDLYLGVGFSIDGQSVTTDTIDSKDSVYTEMKDVLAKKGYSNIINAYELKLVEGTINGKLKATIPVDSKYNGKNVIVLHKKADGTYEEFNSIVKDGEVTIEVTELSPFMVALNGNESNATQVSNVVSNNAQTSSINIILLSILSVSSLCGILYLVLRKKRVA